MRIFSLYKPFIVVCVVFVSFRGLSRYLDRQTYGIHQHESMSAKDHRDLPVFLIILCNSSSHGVESSFYRQIRQLTVLLKSAVVLSSSVLRFVVVSNTEDVFKKVVTIPLEWPDSFQKRLVFERRNIWYPSDRENMISLLRPCASGKLFIPETVNDIDAAVFLDTDTLFLRPPEELLEIVFKFNETQASGFAQTSQGYGGRKIPYPGPRGVNTGIMVLNLTRLRAIPAGWTGTNMNIYDRYRNRIQITATNDIINILLGENPHLLYNLNCIWNYGPGVCWRGSNTCEEAENEGAAIVHGTSASFINGRNPKFKAIFEAWEDYQIGSPLSSLLADMQRRIDGDKSPIGRCNKVGNLDVILTESLRRVVRKHDTLDNLSNILLK